MTYLPKDVRLHRGPMRLDLRTWKELLRSINLIASSMLKEVGKKTSAVLRKHTYIHVKVNILHHFPPSIASISSLCATTVARTKCPRFTCAEDYVSWWSCEFSFIWTYIMSVLTTVPESWRETFPLCFVKTQHDGSSVKKERNGMTMAKKQQKQLEKEVH